MNADRIQHGNSSTPSDSEAKPRSGRSMSTRPLAWMVLIICVIATAGGYYISVLHSNLTAQKQFEDESSRVATAFSERIQIYQAVLHGAAGLFAASISVERSEWKAYINNVSVNTRFPGVDGIGFAAYVPRNQVSNFLNSVRADDAPDFALKNPSPYPELIVVKYLEPETVHREILGTDLSWDPIRRLTAERARDLGGAATTGQVKIGTDATNSEPGFMMMLPVFKRNTPIGTLEQRRANIEGWVYARFITTEFMEFVMGNKAVTLDFELYEGNSPDPKSRMFSSAPDRVWHNARFTENQTLAVGGSKWTISFATNSAFDAGLRHGYNLLVGLGGGGASLLLFGIVWVLSHTRERAVAMADRMTAALRESNEQLQTEVVEREYAQRRIATQYAVTRVLAESPTLREAARSIVQSICESLHWDIGAMWLLNQEVGELHCMEVWSQPGFSAAEFTATTLQITLAQGEGLPGRVWAAGKSAWIVSLQHDDNFPRATSAEMAGLQSGFGFPILMGSQCLGVLEFFSREVMSPDEELLAMMTAAGSQIGQFIDRKRAAEALKDSEAVYQSLVESLPMSVVRKDLQGRITFANQRFCINIGKPLTEILGRTEPEICSTEIAKRHEALDHEVIENGRTLESVEQYAGAEGERRYVQMLRAPVRSGNGLVVGVLGLLWDVTDKHEAEQELEHERFLLHTLMENLPDRIYFKDRESRFIRNSKAHLKRFGLNNAGEAVGKSDFDFFTDEHARQAFEDEQRVMESGQSIDVEERETWPDGSVTWALSTKLPLRNESGETVGTFGISRDITDRKRAEEALRRAKEAAEEASRTKSQFLANMSHELRTPLNSVIGFANILLKNKANNLRREELTFLERILANGKHLLSLINQILDLSKIEARKVELTLAPVALDELVRETVAQQEGQLRARSVKLRTMIPATVSTIATDAEKLKQIIINLIGNALKFTERGSVTVRVVTHPETNVPTRLEVTDTGIGIPPDRLGAIFGAFQQADSSTSRKFGGTGLGLTISQALCQMMGYHIHVSSEVGKGSTFAVVFQPRPAAPVARPGDLLSLPADEIPAGIAASGGMAGKQVLVIDDEEDSRVLLTRMLEEFGCRVTSAASGPAGLQLARAYPPDIITVDLLMPDVDGWEVVRQIKADPQLRNIPVVVVSVIARENRARLFGSVDVLQKPVSKEELSTVLHRSLRLTQPKVLIVDDDADTHQILANYLDEIAAEIRSCSNGREALAALQEFSPDLILLDLMMPHMDGLTFLSELRAMPRHHRVPVVVITAKELTPEETAQLRSNTRHVMKKPEVFGEDLRLLFNQLLRRGQAPNQGLPEITTKQVAG